MGSIYANASRVCIWLGELSRDALISMNMLLLLYFRDRLKDYPEQDNDILLRASLDLGDELIGLGVTMEDLGGFFNVVDVLLTYPSDSDIDLENCLKSLSSEQPILRPDHPIWPALLTFFNHPWYSRIWTLQEIYLAQEAYVLGGHLPIPWDHLSKMRSLLLSSRCINTVYSGTSAKKVGFGNVVGHILELQTSFKLDGNSWGLRMLLLGLVRRHARVEKDYIYGILGIVDDSVRQRIPIDYSTSTPTATVFAQATRLACEVDKRPERYWNDLKMTYKSRRRKLDGLPSWCPDFSNSERDDDIRTCDVQPFISETVADTYQPYAWMEFPVGTNTLITLGF
jgi:hypothetical protein